MDNYKKKTVELASNLALEYKSDPRVIPYNPSKTVIMYEESPTMPRSTPEKHGISSQSIAEMLVALENESSANVHSIVVAKDGEIIAEASAPGFSARLPHLSHSMSKTVTGMLIMLLCDDKKLDTGRHVCDFFDEIPAARERYGDLTVEHLLTMSSGASFSEVGSVTEVDWARAFFESTVIFKPGESFAYNSMNSYMLMRIADKVIRDEYGTSVAVFLKERLFHPLGIRNYFWECDALGIFKGGWGLYLSTESWAKLGTMMMNYGTYEGKVILSEGAVIKATTTHMITPSESGNFNYGYQIWVGRDSSDFLFNGMLGQNVWVCPGDGIVAAVTSGNNELFQDSATLSLIQSHLTRATRSIGAHTHGNRATLSNKCKDFFTSRSWINLHAPRHGLPYALGLKNRTPFLYTFSSLLGEYLLPKNNQGILPLFVRVMQNNYQGGIKSISFLRHGDALRMISHEENGDITIDFGFYQPIMNEVGFSSERYMIYASAEFTGTDSDFSYKLELIFPELPNTRRIMLTLVDSRLHIKMHEIPDNRITDSFVDGIPTMNGRGGPIFELLENNLGKSFIRGKLKELFSPELTAISREADDLSIALSEANDAVTEHIESSCLIRTLLFSVLGISDAARTQSGSLSKILNHIFDRDT